MHFRHMLNRTRSTAQRWGALGSGQLPRGSLVRGLEATRKQEAVVILGSTLDGVGTFRSPSNVGRSVGIVLRVSVFDVFRYRLVVVDPPRFPNRIPARLRARG